MYPSPDITGASEIGTCCTNLNTERVAEKHHIHPEHNDGYDSFKSYNKSAFLLFCTWFSASLIFHECESAYKVTR
jgi:phosphoribulokinase